MKLCHCCEAEVTLESVGARDVCEQCRAYLHCCRNCAFFEPGAHNDCHEPNAELVADKEQGNFCDYFHFAGTGKRLPAAPAGDARAKLDALFGKKS